MNTKNIWSCSKLLPSVRVMSVDWLLREQKGLVKIGFGCFCEKLGASLLSAVHIDEHVVAVAALYRNRRR